MTPNSVDFITDLDLNGLCDPDSIICDPDQKPVIPDLTYNVTSLKDPEYKDDHGLLIEQKHIPVTIDYVSQL